MSKKPQIYTVWERVPDGVRLCRQLGVATDRVLTRSGGVVAGQVWLEVPIDSEWLSASRLVVEDGQLVVSEIRIFPRESGGHRVPGRWSADVLGTRATVPRGGLTARTVRSVRLSEHATHTRKVLAWLQRTYGDQLFQNGRSLGEMGLRPPDRVRPRPSRNTGKPDAFYATLAGEYSEMVSRGERQPIRALAEQQDVRPATLRDWIHEARVRGLLTKGTRGRASGQLTPLAHRVLKRA